MTSTGPDFKTVLDVLSRDDHACVRCGTPARGDRGVQWVIHHRKPRGMGGTERPGDQLPEQPTHPVHRLPCLRRGQPNRGVGQGLAGAPDDRPDSGVGAGATRIPLGLPDAIRRLRPEPTG